MIPNNMYDVDREKIKAEECKGCGRQIGNSEFLIACDGITLKNVVFHARCNPNEPDLQRHHKVTLLKGHWGFELNHGQTE